MQAQPQREPASDLTPRETAILDFERDWHTHAGAKEQEIRSQFALSTARYYQLLNNLIDLPAAVRFDPMLIGRLQRSRDARSESRRFAQRGQGGFTARYEARHDEARHDEGSTD